MLIGEMSCIIALLSVGATKRVSSVYAGVASGMDKKLLIIALATIALFASRDASANIVDLVGSGTESVHINLYYFGVGRPGQDWVLSPADSFIVLFDDVSGDAIGRGTFSQLANFECFGVTPCDYPPWFTEPLSLNIDFDIAYANIHPRADGKPGFEVGGAGASALLTFQSGIVIPVSTFSCNFLFDENRILSSFFTNYDGTYPSTPSSITYPDPAIVEVLFFSQLTQIPEPSTALMVISSMGVLVRLGRIKRQRVAP